MTRIEHRTIGAANCRNPCSPVVAHRAMQGIEGILMAPEDKQV